MVYDLVTEPGEVSSVFNVYARYVEKQEWIFITIDFHNYLGRLSPPNTAAIRTGQNMAILKNGQVKGVTI